PAGRASQCGDSTWRTATRRPVARLICRGAVGLGIADVSRDDHATIALMTAASSANAAYVARDLAHVWHPCTQMKDHEQQLPLIPIRRGAGAWLEDFDGQRYLDAISSWWVTLFGHANPRIN